MESAIFWLLALFAAPAALAAAGVLFGTDSRDAAPDDHLR